MAADQLERERVEWIHGLTGGELERAPLRLFDLHRKQHMEAHYWYEGPPDWNDRLQAYTDGRRGWRGSWRTIVWNTGSHGDYEPPASFKDVRERKGARVRRWRKVASGQSPSEAPCPVPENHPGKVLRREAKLQPPNKYHRDRPRARRAECPLCGARVGDEHGYLSLDGIWLEAVYYSPEEG